MAVELHAVVIWWAELISVGSKQLSEVAGHCNVNLSGKAD